MACTTKVVCVDFRRYPPGMAETGKPTSKGPRRVVRVLWNSNFTTQLRDPTSRFELTTNFETRARKGGVRKETGVH